MSDFKEAYISAGYDYEALAERTCGDSELINQLMQMFLADDSWEKMTLSMQNGDIESAFRAAHSFKGSSGMLGFTALFERMKILTDKLRNGDLEGAKSVFDVTLNEYEAAVKLVSEYM